MTLYLDTSSIIKLYVDEAGSDDMRALLTDADALATSAVAYVEFRAAVARLRRERVLKSDDFEHVKSDFESDWPRYSAVVPTPDLLRTAGGLAEQYRLRTYDAIHLASYQQTVLELGPRTVEFSGFDHALNRAAHSLRRSLLRHA